MKLWHRLGAHPLSGDEWRFGVWAPNARQVQVIGDFSGWWPDDGIPLVRGDDGVWTGVAPLAVAGQRYRYRVLGADGQWEDRKSVV